MASFTALKTAIQNDIRQNGNEEITGDVLQQILLSVVNTMGDGAINTIEQNLSNETLARQGADNTLQSNIDAEALARGNTDTQLQNAINAIKANIDNGYVYAGIATPSSTPVSGKVFYIATVAGTYTNFGGQVLTQGINILRFNGSVWSNQQLIGIDDVPTAGSNNIVKSGGIQNELALGAVYDVSAKNPTAGPNSDGKWESLSALLSDANLNTLIPTAYRKGGMSIKFVHTSDNKYEQHRLMTNSWSIDTNDWSFCGDDVLEDNPEWVDVFIDKNENLVSGTDVHGVKHEFAGIKTPKIHVKELKVEPEGLVDFGQDLLDTGFAAPQKHIFIDDDYYTSFVGGLFLDIDNVNNVTIRYVSGSRNDWFTIERDNDILAQFKAVENSIQKDANGRNSYILLGKFEMPYSGKYSVLENVLNIFNSPIIYDFIHKDESADIIYESPVINNIMLFGNFTNYSLIDYSQYENIVNSGLAGFAPSDIYTRFCLCTKEAENVTHQICAYYNIYHKMTIAYRRKEEGVWSDFAINEIPSFVKYDNHNSITCSFDDDGYIHISGNMHHSNLVYFVSNSPYSIASFEQLPMTGEDETECTYPTFMERDGVLYFAYRYGSAGNGNHYINKYRDGEWYEHLEITNGRNPIDNKTYSAYFSGGINSDYLAGNYNPYSGYYEFPIVWRGIGGVNYCRDIFFIKSTDLEHFVDYRGNALTLPVTVETISARIREIPQGSGVVNSLMNSGFCDEGCVIVYHKFKNDTSQLFALMVGNNSLTNDVQITDWDFKIDLTNSGSGGIALSIGTIVEMKYESIDCFAFSVTLNGVRNRYIIKKSDLSLVIIDDGIVDVGIPRVLYNKENRMNNVGVAFANDPNYRGKYFLRFETMGDNSDKRRNTPITALPTSVKVIECSDN